MLLLALDSSTQVGNICLFKDGKQLEYMESPELRRHSEEINQLIEKALHTHHLQLKDLDLILVGNGPGSFTGIRVAGNIAKTLGLYLKKPLVTYDSLKTMSLCPQSQDEKKFTLCGLNAYKNLIYFAVYQGDKTIVEPCVQSPSQIEDYCLKNLRAEKYRALGDGFEVYRGMFSDNFCSQFEIVDKKWNYPRTDLMCADFFVNQKNRQTIEWNLYSPLYLRASEAEENLGKR